MLKQLNQFCFVNHDIYISTKWFKKEQNEFWSYLDGKIRKKELMN